MDPAFNESGKWNSFLTNIRTNEFVRIYRDEMLFVMRMMIIWVNHIFRTQTRRIWWWGARGTRCIRLLHYSSANQYHTDIHVSKIDHWKSNKYKLLLPDVARRLSSGIDCGFALFVQAPHRLQIKVFNRESSKLLNCIRLSMLNSA